MTILFDATRSVKTRRARVFGQGIRLHDRRAPYSASDLAWWSAQTFADRDLDQRAGEIAALDALEAGYYPF